MRSLTTRLEVWLPQHYCSKSSINYRHQIHLEKLHPFLKRFCKQISFSTPCIRDSFLEKYARKISCSNQTRPRKEEAQYQKLPVSDHPSLKPKAGATIVTPAPHRCHGTKDRAASFGPAFAHRLTGRPIDGQGKKSVQSRTSSLCIILLSLTIQYICAIVWPQYIASYQTVDQAIKFLC